MKTVFHSWFCNALLFVLSAQFTKAIETADSNSPQNGETELRLKAEKGDAEAQFYIGANYIDGIGVPKNIEEGLKWYRKSADQGYAEAQFNLGVMYESGLGVSKDEAEAFKWYLKAAEKGHATSPIIVAQMYQEGRGVTKNEEKAKGWLGKSKQTESDNAPNMESGSATSPPQLGSDDAVAQYRLGLKHLHGIGVPKDEAQSLKFFLQAASKGFAGAQFKLGDMYANGEGVTKDEKEALRWYRMAADKGDIEAQFKLGFIYSTGKGITKDGREAVKWYRKAAQQDVATAQYNLGVIYANGEVVAKDEKEAMKWFRMAADQEHPSAQYNLGFMYANGEGVAKDEKEAMKWFRMAADQEHPLAQYNLGVMYANGEGVTKDDAVSYKWFLLASAKGNEAAKKATATIERRLTLSQRAEGQLMARDFKPRKALESGKQDSGEGIIESRPEATGSGFFITDDGYLITNHHVADQGRVMRVLTTNGTIPAKVVKVDKSNDLALLKADGKFVSLPVAFSKSVRLGATVATVGFPNIGLQGFSPKLAKGEIASLAGIQDDARHFQISVPIQPGNSGGSLVDERGNVVGVVVAKLSQNAALATSGALAENVNYAVKSSYLLSFLESLPEVASKMKEPSTADRKFEDIVSEVEQATVLVLVY
ncbi:MAG: trypsin-like serine protease [Desulfurellales bacterium]|nr:MAG: trypsin-like serine protease [Desulfurellales bacterium]